MKVLIVLTCLTLVYAVPRRQLLASPGEGLEQPNLDSEQQNAGLVIDYAPNPVPLPQPNISVLSDDEEDDDSSESNGIKDVIKSLHDLIKEALQKWKGDKPGSDDDASTDASVDGEETIATDGVSLETTTLTA